MIERITLLFMVWQCSSSSGLEKHTEQPLLLLGNQILLYCMFEKLWEKWFSMVNGFGVNLEMLRCWSWNVADIAVWWHMQWERYKYICSWMSMIKCVEVINAIIWMWVMWYWMRSEECLISGWIEMMTISLIYVWTHLQQITVLHQSDAKITGIWAQ